MSLDARRATLLAESRGIKAATSNEKPREKYMRLASRTATWGFSSMVGLCILVGLVAVLNSPRYVPRPRPGPPPPEDGFRWPDKPDPPTSSFDAEPARATAFCDSLCREEAGR